MTEQGQVKKDFPVKHRETIEDPKTQKKKTHTTIEHHYKLVDHGKPRTVVLNVLGARLSYPSPENFSEEQFKDMAMKLGVEVAAIKAIVQQESGGYPFFENGLPPILYERKHFHDLAVKRKAAQSKQSGDQKTSEKAKHAKGSTPENPYPGYPDLCFPQGGNYGPSGLHQYEKLVRAARLDPEIALKACSWGGFQILGEYFLQCGCSTIYEFVDKFLSGADGQAAIFVEFMRNVKQKAVQALKEHNWEVVAASYNGSNWRVTNPDYASNLGKFYDKFK